MTAVVVLVVIVAVVLAVVVLRVRPSGSIESGISSFRREMRALAPPGQRRARPGGARSADPPDEGAGPGPHPDPHAGPHSGPHSGPRGDGPVPGAG